jgi:transposase
MAYSSDLTDAEWEVFEPLLLEILPFLKDVKWFLSGLCDAICFAATLRDRFQPLLIPTQSSN